MLCSSKANESPKAGLTCPFALDPQQVKAKGLKGLNLNAIQYQHYLEVC